MNCLLYDENLGQLNLGYIIYKKRLLLRCTHRTILNRIQLTIWTIFAFRVMNPHQRSLAKQRSLKVKNCLVSQSATLKESSVQGCTMAKHKTYSPFDDHWVILPTSKAFHYVRAQRDEIRFAFDPP